MGYIQVGHGKVEVGSTGVAVLLIVLLLPTQDPKLYHLTIPAS